MADRDRFWNYRHRAARRDARRIERPGDADKGEGRYGHYPQDYFGDPQGSGYAWRDFQADPTGRGWGYNGEDAYFGEGFDYSPQGYESEPEGPGYGDWGYNGPYSDPHARPPRPGAWGGNEQDAHYPRGPQTGRGPVFHPSDRRLWENICDRLTQHGRLDAREISVEVQDGEVTLNGMVDSRTSKRMAEDTALSVRGVRDVHNRLTLKKRFGE